MKKSKLIALFIIIAMIISNCLPLLSSVVYASPDKIVTVFTADTNDGTLSLRQDGKALIYTMEEVQYEITVREVQSTEPLVEDLMDIAYRGAPDNDYIASELVNYSSMYLRVDAIATQAHPDVSENDIFLEIGGQPIELAQGYSTKSLAQLLAGTDQPENDCLNVYIRKAYNNQGNPGDPGNPGSGNNDNISIIFDNATISRNTISFTLDENTTITATVNGANISNNSLEFPRSDVNNISFTLSGNYNSDTMCVIVRGMNSYCGLLKVTGTTATFEGLNLSDGGIHFSIEYKQGQGGNPGDPNNPGNPGQHIPDVDYSSLSKLSIMVQNLALESTLYYGFNGTADTEVTEEVKYGIDMTSSTLTLKFVTDYTSKPEFFGLYKLDAGEVHGEGDMTQINEGIDMEKLMNGEEVNITIDPSERYFIKAIIHSHDLREIIEDTIAKKATLTEDGYINRSIQDTCIDCGDVVGGRGEIIPIYHPQTIVLLGTSFSYNGKEQKPIVAIKDTQGDIIDSSNYTVTYSAGCKNVGEYKATVTFKNKYEGTKELSFKINKATYDMSKVKFENKTVTYNGKNQSLKATGLPAGVKVTYTNNGKKKVGEYKVTAKFTGDTANYNEIPYKTAKLTIVPKGTSLNKVTKGSKQFKATWKAQKTETTGYEIQYATNKSFTSGKKTVNVKKNKTTSTTVKKLKAKKKYYIRIRTYKTVNGKKIYSEWSKVKNITTKK